MGPPRTTAEVQHQRGHVIVVLRPGAGFGCPVSDLKYDNERKGMMMMMMMMMMIMFLVFYLDLESS